MKIVSKVNGLIIPFTKETQDVLNLDNQKFAQVVMEEPPKEEMQGKRFSPKNKKQEQESEMIETL